MNDLIYIPDRDIRNKELMEVTKEIITRAKVIRRNFYAIAAAFARVESEKLYQDDGFMSAADYAMKIFNMKKSDAYNMIRIGRDYVDQNCKESNLPHKEGDDFNKSQIVAMLPISHDLAKELIENGAINTKLSVRKIKEIIKSNRQAEAVINGDDPGEEETMEDAKSLEETMEDAKSLEDFMEWSITCYNDGNGNIDSVSCKGNVPEEFIKVIDEFL